MKISNFVGWLGVPTDPEPNPSLHEHPDPPHGGTVTKCEICAALVLLENVDRHAEWHTELVKTVKHCLPPILLMFAEDLVL